MLFKIDQKLNTYFWSILILILAGNIGGILYVRYLSNIKSNSDTVPVVKQADSSKTPNKVDLKFYDVIDEPNSAKSKIDSKSIREETILQKPLSIKTARKYLTKQEKKTLDALRVHLETDSFRIQLENEHRYGKTYESSNSSKTITKQTIASEVDSEIQRALKYPGAIVYNVPKKMNIDDYHIIHLVLKLNESADVLKRSVDDKGVKIGEEIKISKRMKASLTGSMFEIAPHCPETQVISKKEATHWYWDIHPKKIGQLSLHLTISAIISVDGQSTLRALKSYEKTIVVEITKRQQFKQFILKYWDWLCTVMFFPFLGWLYMTRKKRSIGEKS